MVRFSLILRKLTTHVTRKKVNVKKRSIFHVYCKEIFEVYKTIRNQGIKYTFISSKSPYFK